MVRALPATQIIQNCYSEICLLIISLSKGVNMKVYLIACDQYIHVIETFSTFFNKYWLNQDVTLLCYKEPEEKLPDNFEVISLGNQEEFSKGQKFWTNGLIPFFENLDEDYFTIILDDQMIYRPVDVRKIQLLEKYVADGRAKKAFLHNKHNKNSIPFDGPVLKLKQDIFYRLSLCAGIWDRKYFLRYLKPNFTAWNFEVINADETMGDGETIIAHSGPNVIDAYGVYRHYLLDPKIFDYINDPEDRKLLANKYRAWAHMGLS